MSVLSCGQGSCPQRLAVNKLFIFRTCTVYLQAGHRKYIKNCTVSRSYLQPVRAGNVAELALVNVDYVSPSLWLGIALAVTGMVLYSAKIRNTRGTEEVDIVAASLFVTCGGVLVLQGWRLDPMLMLSEGVLSAVSIYYMIQTVTLRKELEEQVAPPTDSDRWVGPPQGQSFPRQSELPNRPAQWNTRADTRDRRFLERGDRWASYDESIMFDESYRSRDAGQDVQGLQRQRREVYPYDREDVPRVSSPERRSYGVETSSPDSLVPNDDWNEQPPPRR